MTFDEMVKCLRNGEKVRHVDWDDSEYMYIDSTHRNLMFNTVSDDEFLFAVLRVLSAWPHGYRSRNSYAHKFVC